MDFIRFPPELQLLIAEKLESRELSYLCRANHYLNSLCTPVLERLAQEPRKGFCALHWAIAHGYPELIQLLLSKEHDINHLKKGGTYYGTALHLAVVNEDYPLIVQFLEDPVLDLNKLDRYGDTALHIAVGEGNLKVVKLLHAAGADLEITDKRGRTALLLAVRRHDLRIRDFLVQKGANVGARLPAGTGL